MGSSQEPREIGRTVAKAGRGLRLLGSFSPRAFLRRPGTGPKLVFVHIPKTAGTTVASMLATAYPRAQVVDAGNYLRRPDETRTSVARARWKGEWTGAPLVLGHVPYGVFRESLAPDTPYMTFLREPVDRVLSHYHRHLKRKRTTDSLAAALRGGLPDVNNLATRFLCGDPSPFGALSSSALDDAKANLGGFAFVGIQERFDESIALLQRAFGIGPAPYLNAHVSVGRPAVDDIPDQQLELIEEHNQLDRELYEFAVELFQRRLAATGGEFAAEVAGVRASSERANEEAVEKAREWLDRELSTGATRPIATLYAAAEADGIPEPALRNVIAQSSLRKVKDRDGQRAFARPPR